MDGDQHDDDHHDSDMPGGQPSGTPAEALDCACDLYLADPGTWLSTPDAGTAAN